MIAVYFSKKSEKEILDSFKYYENKQVGLGDKMLENITAKINQLIKTPQRYPLKKQTYREAVLKTFPFVIVYRYNKTKNFIFISSIFHTSRNPKRKYI